MEIKTPQQSDDANVQDGPDGVLLEQFINDRNQDAFAALMKRHGSYVLRVCRHLTSHVEDAEDIFQACFLELVRKAGSIRERNCVAGWLQTVAVRLAYKAAVKRSRRQQREAQAVSPATVVSPDDISWREACRILEEEIAQLADELRLPIILCLFRDHSQEEAARELGIATRTVKARLRRGREQLRQRLIRRGVTLAVLGTLLSAGDLQAAVPAGLQQVTLQGALAVAGKESLAGVVSPAVIGLTGKSSLVAGGNFAVAILAATLLIASATYVLWDLLTPPVPPGEAAPKRSRRVQRSFRGQQFDAGFLQWSGPTPKKYVRLEDEGLRITLPAQNGPADAVGVKLRYPVRGDFELETTLELLEVARPGPPPTDANWNAGASVYLFLDTAELDGLWLGKMMEQFRGPVLNCGHRIKAGKERLNKFLINVPTGPEKGLARLRVNRKGAAFSLFAGEGAAGKWQLLANWEVSAADVSIVRFAADPVWISDVALDVRFIEFTITAEDFVGYDPPTPQAK